MDGQFDRLDELIYVESHLSNLSTKFYGEVTQQMLKHADFPGSNNGTGLFQTIVGLKIRDLFEQIIASRAAAPLEATKAWSSSSYNKHTRLIQRVSFSNYCINRLVIMISVRGYKYLIWENLKINYMYLNFELKLSVDRELIVMY